MDVEAYENRLEYKRLKLFLKENNNATIRQCLDELARFNELRMYKMLLPSWLKEIKKELKGIK